MFWYKKQYLKTVTYVNFNVDMCVLFNLSGHILVDCFPSTCDRLHTYQLTFQKSIKCFTPECLDKQTTEIFVIHTLMKQ